MIDIAPLVALVVLLPLLLAAGVPVAFAIALASLVPLLLGMPIDAALVTVAQRTATGLDSFALLAIPFFILSGELMRRGGSAERLVRLGKALVGFLPAGLLAVNVVACMLFGAISGSAVAATAAVGGFLIPRMAKEGYRRSDAVALTITASTTGLLIPPSNILIVYALASGGVSVAALFLAGYLPGLLVGLVLFLVAGTLAVRGGAPPTQPFDGRELGAALVQALPSLFLIVLVMGGIVGGVFTATEAAAIAVLYAVVLAVLWHREISWRQLPPILVHSASTTGVVLLLVATSMGLAWTLAYLNVPQTVAAALLGIAESRWAVLLIVNVVLLAVGTFLDMTPAVLIFTPIFLPVMLELGIDPIHFGILMVLNLCIGLCTPPVGTVLFVGMGVGRTPLGATVRSLLPLYVALLLALAAVTWYAPLSLALPRAAGM